MKRKNIFKSRKFKYGSVAIVFTVVFVVLVILANLIFTALDDKFNLKYDMTDRKMFTISQATIDALQGIDTAVTIKFLKPIDKVEEDQLGKYIKECAESYSQKFSNIKIEYIDVIAHPDRATEYRKLGLKDTSSVVVESSHHTVIIDRNSFFSSSGGYVTAFGGERKFTSAILQVTNPVAPVVTFTDGHGEDTAPFAMLEVFTNAGYVVKKADLSRENLDPATEILIINNPTSDFLGLESANEIQIINDYMNNMGHVMVFLSADNTNPLPELDALLASRGVEVKRGTKIIDIQKSIGLDTDGVYINALKAGQMYGKRITDGITGKFIMDNAAPIEILFKDKAMSDDGTSYVYNYDTIYVDPVLSSSDSAYITLSDGTRENGTFYPMVISSKYKIDSNNQKVFSHMLVVANDSFANYIGSNSFGNENLLYQTMTIMGKSKVPLNIEYKMFDSTTLTPIDKSTLTKWSVLLIGIIPLSIAAVGCAVWVKRRHR